MKITEVLLYGRLGKYGLLHQLVKNKTARNGTTADQYLLFQWATFPIVAAISAKLGERYSGYMGVFSGQVYDLNDGEIRYIKRVIKTFGLRLSSIQVSYGNEVRTMLVPLAIPSYYASIKGELIPPSVCRSWTHKNNIFKADSTFQTLIDP